MFLHRAFRMHWIDRTSNHESITMMPVRMTFLICDCLLLFGCATTIPRDYEHTASTAYADPDSTELGRLFQSEIYGHPGESGMILLSSGEWGFRARAGLSNQAEKTIDVQYYIWEVDTSGHPCGTDSACGRP